MPGLSSGKRPLEGPSGSAWKGIGTKKRAGVVVPLFSVYSEKSVGIGELDDIRILVDWCAKTGNSILQFLPLNEVGPVFCPYDSISSFALEPAYLSLGLIPGAGKGPAKSALEKMRKDFPAGGKYVDYRIKEAKLVALRAIFAEGADRDDPGFKAFLDENSYWIRDFSLFKALKDEHGGKPWYDWGAPFRDREEETLGMFSAAHREELEFHRWTQWHLFRQFVAVKAYAASKGVLLKGDLPVLVSRDSADVWAHPEYFKLDYAAGAPPDMYCAKGQRWGTPTYDWPGITRDGYTYIRKKLRYAENFYDLLRIDHVVGLLRIWSIPYGDCMENAGLNGFFDPGDENVWEEHGRVILSVMLESTSMLLTAEDLGMIPKACPKLLEELGIPGNDVQRWVKDWQVKHDFLKPSQYRALAVAMLSTHDTTNWAAWWEHEAGTVDEGLFARKCEDRGIDLARARARLFDAKRSGRGRLRWREDISTADILTEALGKRREEAGDFVEMYENTFLEKEKLWRQLKMDGPMRERSDAGLVRRAFGITLSSRAVFNIELIFDWLFLADMFEDDPIGYRVNTPGTVDPKNWSLVLPISLEGLLGHAVTKEVRKMIIESGRG